MNEICSNNIYCQSRTEDSSDESLLASLAGNTVGIFNFREDSDVGVTRDSMSASTSNT